MTAPRISGTPCGARLKNPREDGRTTCVKLVIPSGRCRSHGGGAPQAERGRLQRLTEAQAMARARASLPASEPVTPEAALQQELQRTHARIRGLELMIASGDPVGGVTVAAMGEAMTAERGQLHRVAADMVRLSVTARIESVLDTQAAEMLAFVREFVTALGLRMDDPMVTLAVRAAAEETDRQSFTPLEQAAARARLGR